MEWIFEVGQVNRAAVLQQMMQSLGCSYICLWSHFHLPPNSNCLIYFDGVYQEQSYQSTLTTRLFHTYCESVNNVDQGRFPGFAFKSNLPYIEFKLECFLRFASSQVQIQFYQEAGIKTVVFMGCAVGEIEIGLPSDPQVDLKMEIENLFPPDFSREATALGEVSQLSINYNLPTTPSSLSGDTTSNYAFPHSPYSYNNVVVPSPAAASLIADPRKEASCVQHNAARKFHAAAFTRYQKDASTVLSDGRLNPPSRHHSMFKRSVLFFRNLRHMNNRTGNRPTPTQVHHMISERRRREKLNDSFQVLRSLLPPGSKKDKASVLSTIISHLTSLKSQVEELQKRNQELESQLSTVNEKAGRMTIPLSCFSTNEKVSVEISRDSEARVLNLSVGLRSEECGMLDLVIRVLNLLKEQRNNVRLVSMQSNIGLVDQENPLRALELRFKLEGDDGFDGCDFQEAVKRVVMMT